MKAKKNRDKKVISNKIKQFIGFVRDHSGSMSSLARSACKDFNDTLEVLKNSSKKNKIDSCVTVVECDTNPRICEVGVDIDKVNPLNHYGAHGSTPLWNSVGTLIGQILCLPKVDDKNSAVLLIITTDGQDTDYGRGVWNISNLMEKIRTLQGTDRWTITFRVPKGSYKRALIEEGIPEGNIVEWDQTVEGVKDLSTHTQVSTQCYMNNLTRGVMASKSFYSDLSDVKPSEVRDNLQAITNKCRVWKVDKTDAIRPFCEKNLKKEPWVKGAAFYQLTKPETVQNYKKFLIRTKKSGAIYAGKEAREMLGLKITQNVDRLVPGDHGEFDLFVQSTSVNRKLVTGTDVIYCPEAV